MTRLVDVSAWRAQTPTNQNSWGKLVFIESGNLLNWEDSTTGRGQGESYQSRKTGRGQEAKATNCGGKESNMEAVCTLPRSVTCHYN